MNSWDKLSNAEHIDRFFQSFNNHNDFWEGISDDNWNAAWEETINLLPDERNDIFAECRKLLDVVCPEGPAWDAGMDTLLALIAYDDCAYMLDSDPGELAILAKFKNTQANLLLPACIAFHKEKELG